jgi:hypothetical protein
LQKQTQALYSARAFFNVFKTHQAIFGVVNFNFRQFSAKKLALFFSKTNVMIKVLQKLADVT